MKPKTTTVKKQGVVQLSCMERVMILSVLDLHKEGNFILFKTLGELRSKIGFTAKEITDFELKSNGPSITWNVQGMQPVPFELSDHERELIRKPLLELDGASKLTNDHLSIYQLFVV
jgi:hypothetical protein